MALQQHHCGGDRLADLQAQARAAGWKLAPSPATLGKGGGSSAGTAVAVPLHRGWSTTIAGTWDASPSWALGRLTGCWVQAGARTGILFISIYCWSTEGASDRNIALVEAAFALAAEFGGLWLLAGDFNMVPSQLTSAMGRLLERAGASVQCAGEPTNYPARGEARELDYFLIDVRLREAVKSVKVHASLTGNPHRAVLLTLKVDAACGLVRAIVRPKAFPRERPVGCPRKPVVPALGDEAWAEQALRDAASGNTECMAARWCAIAGCIEAELCRQCDLVDSEGRPLKEFLGRGEGLRVRWKRVLPPRIAGQHGQADSELHRLRWTLNRVEELVHLEALRCSGPLRAKQLEQWHRILYNLSRPRGQLAELAAKDPRWGDARDALLAMVTGPTGACGPLRSIASRLQLAIDEVKVKLAAERKSSWRAWLSHHLGRVGGGPPQVLEESAGSP